MVSPLFCPHQVSGPVRRRGQERRTLLKKTRWVERLNYRSQRIVLGLSGQLNTPWLVLDAGEPNIAGRAPCANEKSEKGPVKTNAFRLIVLNIATPDRHRYCGPQSPARYRFLHPLCRRTSIVKGRRSCLVFTAMSG